MAAKTKKTRSTRGRPKTADARISVAFRVDSKIYAQLNELCAVNRRSQRELIEIMISKYHGAWRRDPSVKLNP
jgi:hypothetical protein